MRAKINSVMLGPMLLMGAQYTTQIVWPLVNLLVVRYLGPEQFGLYASAIAIITLLTFIPDFGLQQAALNLNARNQFSILSILRKSMRMGMAYAGAAILLVIVWISLVPYDDVEIKWLAVLMSFTFLRVACVTVITTRLQINGNYSRIAIWNLSISSSQWISTLVLMFFDAGLYVLIVAPIGISLVIAGIMMVVQGRDLILKPSASEQPEQVPLKELFGGSWKFGVASSMHQLYYKSDAALMSVFRAPVEVGYYTVAFKLIELFFLFPGVVFNQVLYPKYVVWCRDNVQKLKMYYSLMNKVMILTGIIVTFFLLFFSRDLLGLLFGEKNKSAIQFLNLLAFAVPLRFWVSSAGAVLTNEKLIVVKMKIQAGIAVLNVSLNLLLIPLWGGIGAAAAMIATHVVLLAAYEFAAHKFVFGFEKRGTFTRMAVHYPIGLFVLGTALYELAGEQSLLLKILACGFMVILVVPGTWGWLKKGEKNQLLSLIRKPAPETAGSHSA
ncbi:oligosaccharide flippase family protein [Cohnella fermenti]|uniref:Polysaccharide biosynthesis protein C-terminal domain-containing protein n=1 Tax=Cohnella fermenti TaxID=2565925 RepID=A0A4S4BJ81_9BACL|nr:oligosaccharide flippase family protein [Cohnella fermenti]THF74697.1 hypothetical protein E6C55_24095 [Cohnella fermenti]